MQKILLVDDNSIDRELVRRLLGADHDVTEAATAYGALGYIDERSFDCVVLDYHLPDEDGAGFLATLAARKLPLVMLTARAGPRSLVAHAIEGRELEAASGRRALEIVERMGRDIDLVLTDVIMPDLGGMALVDALRRHRQETRVLFMSGYDGDDLRSAALPHSSKMIQKPITSEVPAKHVRKALAIKHHAC